MLASCTRCSARSVDRWVGHPRAKRRTRNEIVARVATIGCRPCGKNRVGRQPIATRPTEIIPPSTQVLQLCPGKHRNIAIRQSRQQILNACVINGRTDVHSAKSLPRCPTLAITGRRRAAKADVDGPVHGLVGSTPLAYAALSTNTTLSACKGNYLRPWGAPVSTPAAKSAVMLNHY